ncbi:hypothetical protein GCM10020358_78440 [Amorphoplanes nipponensis]|uniref:Uncharacterized protein n=1 Tax=Actinoplanes nipponensis TaxID=135950 RepID=A0A919JP65_9ACTN|nr:hypothetical protein [Actinoplanes nipponensis]GIE52786.1 hypothetical protein Ani05nite_63200 [Actinoplanes nipponensis]
MSIEQQPEDQAERAEQADAPTVPEGEDVRVGPEQSDEPQAGAAEPTD